MARRRRAALRDMCVRSSTALIAVRLTYTQRQHQVENKFNHNDTWNIWLW
jgi:hypothetical protein